MPFKLLIDENTVFGKRKYLNAKGNTECVEFVRMVTSAPHTLKWLRGRQVKSFKEGELIRGTAIATFDDKGRYPTDKLGMHAAIYLSHTNEGIQVLDQWTRQGEVKPRMIRFNRPDGTSRSDDGDTFYVVE